MATTFIDAIGRTVDATQAVDASGGLRPGYRIRQPHILQHGESVHVDVLMMDVARSAPPTYYDTNGNPHPNGVCEMKDGRLVVRPSEMGRAVAQLLSNPTPSRQRPIAVVTDQEIKDAWAEMVADMTGAWLHPPSDGKTVAERGLFSADDAVQDPRSAYEQMVGDLTNPASQEG